jgi:hypothetical protein
MIDSAPMRSAGVRLAVIAVACAPVLAGCGGGDEQGASDVAQSYVEAQNQRNFEQVCALFSDQLRQQLGGDKCPGFLDEQSSGIARRQIKVVSVSEAGDRASARLETAGESGAPVNLMISLARQDDDWRITSVGGAGG